MGPLSLRKPKRRAGAAWGVTRIFPQGKNLYASILLRRAPLPKDVYAG